MNESEEHINYLEILSAFNGLKCSLKTEKSCEILLRIDNTTAISCINRLGSIQYPRMKCITNSILEMVRKS